MPGVGAAAAPQPGTVFVTPQGSVAATSASTDCAVPHAKQGKQDVLFVHLKQLLTNKDDRAMVE